MIEKQILLAYYGDDFTGSTDVMEALAMEGYRTVLFLEEPTKEMIQQFEDIRCIGVAGTARAKTPSAMEQELKPIMESLAKTGAPLVHYKVCSTFDSSPTIGSIGKAIQVSREFFQGQSTVPVLVGAPRLGRYTVFGQHFAKLNEHVYRLDRHPVMSRHPVTPMDEADLHLHLGKQLDGEKIGLMDILSLDGEDEKVLETYNQMRNEDHSVVIFDVLDEERLERSGMLLWETTGETPQLAVGSSGVEYALTAYWNSMGLKGSPKESDQPIVHPVDQLLVVSGSASLVSQRQIENAIEQGFVGIKIPVESLINNDLSQTDFLDEVAQKLQTGKNVVLYTALGPEDEAISKTRELFSSYGIDPLQTGEWIGKQLGRLTKSLLEKTDLRRVVIAGGDTSGFATNEMGIYGLEMLLPISPGAPLCKAYSEEGRMDGLELLLKSGQFGTIDFYTKVKNASSDLDSGERSLVNGSCKIN